MVDNSYARAGFTPGWLSTSIYVIDRISRYLEGSLVMFEQKQRPVLDGTGVWGVVLLVHLRC